MMHILSIPNNLDNTSFDSKMTELKHHEINKTGSPVLHMFYGVYIQWHKKMILSGRGEADALRYHAVF